MVSFEIFVKAMPPSLLELKVLPSFCFAFKIPDDVTASNLYLTFRSEIHMTLLNSIFSSRHESFHSYDDDHDLGEIGGDADVACDFGGDFGGF